MSSAAAATTPPSVSSVAPHAAALDAHARVRAAWHFSIACSTSFSTSCGDGPVGESSAAMRRRFDGAQDRGLERRVAFLEIQRDLGIADPAPQRQDEAEPTRPAKTSSAMTRNEMMAVGAEAQRFEARGRQQQREERAATTITAPRSASLRRQRLRTRWMTSTSSARRSEPCASVSHVGSSSATLRVDFLRIHPAVRVVYGAPEAPVRRARKAARVLERQVRDDHFGGEEQQAGDQQVPPEALALFGLFRRQLGGACGAPVTAVGVARPVTAATSSLRVERRQVRLGRVDVHGDPLRARRGVVGGRESRRRPARSARAGRLGGRASRAARPPASRRRGRRLLLSSATGRRPRRPSTTTAAARTDRGTATSWCTSGR